MKFSEMPYVRPDLEQVREEGTAYVQALINAADFAQADAAFHQYSDMGDRVSTAVTLVSIRHSINTEDAFYAKEQEVLDEMMPLLQQLDAEFNKALYNSKFRPQFTEKYGELLFTNLGIQLRAFDEKLIPDMQEENKLVTAYNKLIASAQIPFEGQVLTLSQLSPYMQSADDALRHKAWEANNAFFDAHKQELDDIYDKLTALRTGMGRKLGYDNYIPLGYDRMNRNCYGEKDVDSFRQAIVKYVVPVADKLYRQQAERTSLPYPLSYKDASLMFRSGNPVPQGDAEDILREGRAFYHWLSPEAGEFIDCMFDNELMDVLSRKGKESGGYCTSLPVYKCPFIFANFNGTQHDVEVMTHEAGHAFAAYEARNIFPSSYHWPTLESCEIHSMSMEFFGWAWAEKFFGPQAEKFRYSHLAGALTFLPYGTMVDHFQHIVYAHPELTPAQRNAEWARLTKIYLPWISLGDLSFYAEGRYWQRQGHIYGRPFYYIDYCLAQSVALQFWALMQQDREAAWKRYYALVKLAGTKTYTELVASAGLMNPFGEESLQTICEAASKWLDAQDLSAIR